MGITGHVVDATREFFLSFGAAGLFAVAFLEAVFFPVPPDLILIPLAIATPDLALLYAGIATAGSVVGAVAAYYIGYRGGRPVLDRFVSDRNMDRVQAYYDEYGVLAVGIAGFTPIPYKVFTLSSGAFRLSLPGFVVVSVLSRGIRFFLEAVLILLYGEQILSFLTGLFGVVTVALAVVMVLLYIVWKQYW